MNDAWYALAALGALLVPLLLAGWLLSLGERRGRGKMPPK